MASASLITITMHATTTTMTTTRATDSTFYRETKWCGACAAQVRYLASVDHSFCVQCGGKVRLFASDERSRVAEAAQRHRSQAV